MKHFYTKFIYKTLSLTLMVGACKSTFSQQFVLINQQNIQLNNNIQQFSSTILNNPQPILVYLKFKPGVAVQNLKTQGLKVQEYLGAQTYSVLIDQDRLTNLFNLVEAWEVVKPEEKISTYFKDKTDNKRHRCLVSLVSSADSQSLKPWLQQLLPEQPWKSQNKFILELNAAERATLALQPFVHYISPKPMDQSLNNESVSYNNAAIVQQSPVYQLKGTGVTLGVGDDTYSDHIDIRDRSNNLNPESRTIHGIHTAVTAAGAGIKDERYTGFAPKANLVTNFFSNIIAYGAEYEQAFGMKLTNNSYAAVVGNCSYAGTYDGSSQYLDQQATDHPELLNIFAAGNDGGETCGDYPVRYGTVVGAYSSAKNVLVVSLSGKHQDHLNIFGSAGPVKDGRLKPELTAMGTDVISGGFDNSYQQLSGTSMACPAATGAAALLIEQYKKDHANANPKSGLIKAALMNGAVDFGNPGPDYLYGFGLMNVKNAVDIIKNNQFIESNINHGGTNVHTINIPPNTGQVKIMLYWNDVAGSPMSNKALVNDLDLSVLTTNNTTVLPLVLNSSPTLVNQPAQPGVDRINNVEQVTINNPSAGTYTLQVNGFNIPSGPQSYTIVYYFAPLATEISYPTVGTKLEAGQPVIVHWNALGTNDPFSISATVDGGATWTPIATIAGTGRYQYWVPPAGTQSSQCKIKIIRNGSEVISDNFTVSDIPQATLAASQCPGNIQIEWPAISGVNKYYLYLKKQGEMVLTDSSTSTSYTYKGLSPDSTYWVAVSTSINEKPGLRSIAIERQPSDGDCANINIDGDLMITKVLQPLGGRLYTQSVLSNNQAVVLEVRNNDNIIANQFQIQYRINGGTWNSQTFNNSINPGSSSTITVSNLPLQSLGTYQISFVIKNLAITDPVPQNDTLHFMLKQVDNPVIDLNTPWLADFESMPSLQTSSNYFSLPQASAFDFETNQKYGRLRSFVQASTTIDGARSINLDNAKNMRDNISASALNSVIGTFNLENYQVTQDELRFELKYTLHGKPIFNENNRVYLRGNDANPWIPLATFDSNSVGQSTIYGAVSMRDHLLTGGQNYSSATQIKITQRDTTLIGGKDFGSGLTIDNIKIFKAIDDISLVSVENIDTFNCNISSPVPLTVRVGNTMPTIQSNIPIHFSINNGPVFSDIIPTLNPRDTINFTFSDLLPVATAGAYTLDVWLSHSSDNYANNDSITGVPIHNQALINTFPYLERFEVNDGIFFTAGKNSSWIWGTPNSASTNHAASGSKAWSTSKNGGYNANEKSYLYSPCFDISTLNQPMLSFSLFKELEDSNSGQVFDSAWVEYSTDGGNSWLKLGNQNQGYNWYNHENNHWLGTSTAYWQVASCPLPLVNNIAFRWVLNSDPGAEFSGIGIDDIHVYDYNLPIYQGDSIVNGQSFSFIGNQILSQNGNAILGTDANGQNWGNTTLQTYLHADYISSDSQQMFLPRSFTLKGSQNNLSDSVNLHFYIHDTLMQILRNDDMCNACTSKPTEIYQLGITTYTDPNPNMINGVLLDDVGGTFNYTPRSQVAWTPYGTGYIATLKTNLLGEYWFNDGGVTQNNALPNYTLSFTAEKFGGRKALLKWQNTVETLVSRYELQSDEGTGFSTKYLVSSTGNNNTPYSYLDSPSLDLAPLTNYRLRYTLVDGTVLYSPIRKIIWDHIPTKIEVFPNPLASPEININWYNTGSDGFDWSLYNILGQKVAKGYIQQNTFSGNSKISLQNTNLSNNIYILKLKFNNELREFKLLYQAQ